MKTHKIRVWFLAVLVLFPFTALLGQQKYALIIGNSGYTSISPLKNPVNDAQDMQAVLQSLGFQAELLIDGGLEQMESAVNRFKNRLSLSKDAYGFFFYAGHGVQSNGENYLIPVDAAIASETALRLRAVAVQAILDEISEAGNILNIVVLDACRDNPFAWGRGGKRGLQVIGNPPAESIIVYAASAGGVALDGEGRNGLFTAHLLQHLKTPGLEFREVCRRTREDVRKASGEFQRPALYDQSDRLVRLAPESAPKVQPVNPPDFSSAVTFYNQGVEFFNQGEYDKAIAEFTVALRINPNYADAYIYRGVAYEKKGEYDREIADCTQALRIDPNYALAYNNRGAAYKNKGEYDKAIADCTEALRINPNFALAYNNRGAAYNNKGEYDKAIADCTQALRIDPNLALAYNNRGDAYYKKGEYDKTIADCTEALRINPNYALAYNNRGAAYQYGKKDYDKAVADFTQANRLDPSNQLYRDNLQSARNAQANR